MIIYVMKNLVVLDSRPPFILNSVTHESAVPSMHLLLHNEYIDTIVVLIYLLQAYSSSKSKC